MIVTIKKAERGHSLAVRQRLERRGERVIIDETNSLPLNAIKEKTHTPGEHLH